MSLDCHTAVLCRERRGAYSLEKASQQNRRLEDQLGGESAAYTELALCLSASARRRGFRGHSHHDDCKSVSRQQFTLDLPASHVIAGLPCTAGDSITSPQGLDEALEHHPLRGYDQDEQAPADVPSTPGEPTIATPASGVLGEVTKAEIGDHGGTRSQNQAGAGVDATSGVQLRVTEAGQQREASESNAGSGAAALGASGTPRGGGSVAAASASESDSASGPALHVTPVGHARVFDIRDMERTPLDAAALQEAEHATDPAAIMDGESSYHHDHHVIMIVMSS